MSDPSKVTPDEKESLARCKVQLINQIDLDIAQLKLDAKNSGFSAVIKVAIKDEISSLTAEETSLYRSMGEWVAGLTPTPSAIEAQNPDTAPGAQLAALAQIRSAQGAATTPDPSAPIAAAAPVRPAPIVSTAPAAATVQARPGPGAIATAQDPSASTAIAAPESHTPVTAAAQTPPAGPPPDVPCPETPPKPTDTTAGFCLTKPVAGETNISGYYLPATPNGQAKKPPPTIEISVKVNDIPLPDTPSRNTKSGVFRVPVDSLNQYDKVTADGTETDPSTKKVTDIVPISVPVSGPSSANSSNASTANSISKSGLLTLGLFGIDVTGTSASGPSQQYFASFDITAPLAKCTKNVPFTSALQNKCWVWFDPRIASAPTATTSAINSLNTTSGVGGASSQTVGSITQTIEFQTGFEYYLSRSPYDGKAWGFKDQWTRGTVSLIAGGGLLTPFSTNSQPSEYTLNANLVQQFNTSSTLQSQYQQLAAALCEFTTTPATPMPAYCANLHNISPNPSLKTVALLFPNRSRMYRDFYAGLRFRAFFFKGVCGPTATHPEGSSETEAVSENSCRPQGEFPATVDLRFGEDETVTGGHLVPIVMTIAGNFPVPGTNGTVRIFGAFYTRLRGNHNSTNLVLVPAATPIGINDPSVVVQQIQPQDQDYYRLGIGVDLVKMISKWANPGGSQSASSSPQ